MRLLAASYLLCALASEGDPIRQLHAVVDTMQNLLLTIEGEEKKEKKNHKCYMKWCRSEQDQKKNELDELKLAQEDLGVIIDRSETIESLNAYQVKSNMKEIKEIISSMDTAEAVRADERKQYETDRSLNTQSIKQLDVAIRILDRSARVLVQTGQKTSSGQSDPPGDSSFVVGVFRSLKQNMERNQASADKDEEKRKKLFDRLISEKKELLKNLTSETEAKQIIVAEMKQKAVQATNDLRNNNSGSQEGTKYLAQTKEDCEIRKREWQVRQADRQKEKAAIEEAISFLKITFEEAAVKQAAAENAASDVPAPPPQEAPKAPSFLQFEMRVPEPAPEQRHRPRTIRALPNSFLNLASLDLASANSMMNLSTLSSEVSSFARSDRFVGIKKQIKGLVEALKREQEEEATKKKRCEKMKKLNKNELENAGDSLTQVTSLLSRKSEIVQSLTNSIGEIREMIKESKKGDEDMRVLREKEHNAYVQGTKERKLALKVLLQAKTALKKFYESKVSLAQAPPPKQEESAGRHDNESKVVLAMLDKIRDDITREQRASEKEEKEAQAAFEKQQKEGVKEFDQRMEELTEMSSRRAKTSVQLNNTTEDAESLKEKLKAVKGKIRALADECDQFLHEYERRDKSISFEISQLLDAHDIFSGASEAVRTGMLR